MMNIVGIGNALVDVITLIDNDSTLDRFGLPKGSMQLVDSTQSQVIKTGTSGFQRTFTAGGSAANTIHGLAKLGIKAGFIGSVGHDETGILFESQMKEAGVLTNLKLTGTATGTSVSLVSPDSERTMATHLGAAVELNPADLSSKSFEGFDILYLEGYLIINKALTLEACRLAKESDMKIAIDLASYNVVESNLDPFKEVISKYIDIVFANEEESKAFTGLDIQESLNAISNLCETAVIKAGAEGSWIKRGEELIKVGTIKVNPRDTTGAGDLYAAGFLSGYSRGYSLDICGQMGALLAGNVIEVAGAKMDEERWKKISTDYSALLTL